MAASTALRSVDDIESFMIEYYAAWGGTDEDRIMSYYADNVTVQIPGSLMQGQAAVREQFVRPFITAFPGNRHFVKNIIFGHDVAVIEFTFKAEHKGPFAGRAATDAGIELPGCGVYEYDSARRQITAARIYFDVATLLKQISSQQPQVLQDLLISWFAARAVAAKPALSVFTADPRSAIHARWAARSCKCRVNATLFSPTSRAMTRLRRNVDVYSKAIRAFSSLWNDSSLLCGVSSMERATVSNK